MKAKANKVLIMAGGTGGHIFPALAVADILHSQGAEIYWLGSEIGLEKTIVPERYPLFCIAAQRIRGKGWRTLLFAPWRLIVSTWQAIRILQQLKPDVALAMGGFACGPGGIAAKISGIPLMIHEQNAVAGYTNRLLAKIANRVAAAYPGAFAGSSGATVVGNPVRLEIVNIPPPIVRLAKRQGPLRILVLGGSQGAHALNELVIKLASDFAAQESIELWHQTGKNDYEQMLKLYAHIPIIAQVQPFISDMAAAYQWADLLICRAGALTIAEITAVGVASVLVPFPAAADDHQWHNAKFLEQAGAAKLFRQPDLTLSKLTELIESFIHDRSQILSMAQKAAIWPSRMRLSQSPN